MIIHKPYNDNWLVKSVAFLMVFALLAFNYSSLAVGIRGIPDAYFAEDGETLAHRLLREGCPRGLSVEASAAAGETLDDVIGTVEYRLFGLFPIKKVYAYSDERAYLTPCGLPVGISIYTEGVLTVGLGSFTDESGRQASPAAEAGLKPGDVILSANGAPVSTAEELQQAIDSSPEGVYLSVVRNGDHFGVTVHPRPVSSSYSSDGAYRIGAWIRDSTVGIGTLTYYDAATGSVAALGHAVVDADTGTMLSVRNGSLKLAEVIGVTPGMQGAPGELHGTFDGQSLTVGTITDNTELGIFGSADAEAYELLNGDAIPVAFPDEVHTGAAELLAAVEVGGNATAYSCRIVKTGSQNKPAQKGLVIQITDQRLFDATGGIVQGMSGSPVLQDGRLVGVITHVFVNDPHRGYGAYAYWMYKTGGDWSK